MSCFTHKLANIPLSTLLICITCCTKRVECVCVSQQFLKQKQQQHALIPVKSIILELYCRFSKWRWQAEDLRAMHIGKAG